MPVVGGACCASGNRECFLVDWADLMLMRLLEKPDCEINSHLGKPFISHIEESDLSLGVLHRAPVWVSTATPHGSNHLPLGGMATH